MAPPGRRRHNLSPAAVFLGLVFLFGSTASAASAVLGVDLGTEYFKAALVKPGIPLEIVLTKDSKRKELSAVAFKPSRSGALPAGEYPERFYGSDAVALQARFPGDVYPNLKQLLGMGSDADAVQVYTSRYPALKAEGIEGRKTVALKSGVFAEGEPAFSVEELLAMELQNVKENARALAGKGVDISDVVFTVPPFYTVEERRALEVAAKLADLKVLSVVSDGLAVGINYATSRSFPVVNEGGKPEINLVFDMGAGSASATVLKFQGRTVKDVGRRNKTIQEVQVMGTGWDRTLGGDALNQLIVDDMISSFVNAPAAKSASITADQVKAHGRTAAKLFKDAEKTRQVLSANTQTSAFFESLYEDVDFRYKISRADFEKLAAGFAERVDGPINRALEAAGLSIADIDSLVVHGGASRTPFVQQRLEALVGKAKIKANVNSDEAAVFGAAFKAAGLSPSFRVKEIRDADTQGYTHGIQYMFNLKDRDQKVFTPSSKVGATKDLPFQMMGEFEFSMYQAAPNNKGDVIKSPVLHFASGNLTRAVSKMIDEEKCDRDSFNNYVQVRLSPVTGVPEVTSAWVTCDTEEPKAGIVDGVKNFFGMGDKKDQEPLKEGESSSESASSSSSTKSSKSSKGSKTSSSTAAAEASEDAKPKKKTIRSAITYTVTAKGYEKHPRKEFKRMQDRLIAFDASDKNRRVREEVLNSLEAFTYRARDHLEDEAFIAVSTAEVRSTLESLLSATSDWIYSEGGDAPQDILKAKLKALEDIVKPILKRKTEAVDRPAAIQKFESNIADMNNVAGIIKKQLQEQEVASSKSSEAVSKASVANAASPSPSRDSLDELEDEDPSASETPADPEITPVPTIYTDEDLKAIEEAYKEAKTWLEEKQAAQSKLKDTDEPALTSEDVKVQSSKLEQAIVRMMTKKANVLNQPKAQKPKAKPKKKPAKKDKKKPAKKDSKADEPSQEELDEALKKAGIKGEGVKLKNFGAGKDGKVTDKDGNLLTKLELGEDATEEEIMAAIEKATEEGRKARESKGSDEL